MLSLRCSDSSVDFASRLSAEKASYFLINKTHDFIVVDYVIGLDEVVMHETYIRVGIGV